MIDEHLLYELTEFRKVLHKNAELSDNESKTSALVFEKIKKANPGRLIENLGGYGFAAVYEGLEKGKTLLIRAELDALPVTEINTFKYRSAAEGVSHKCGHDGHMAILAGVAGQLGKNKLHKGIVVLLFQPSEEIGTGAERIIKDDRFSDLRPDYSVALHNLPGFEKGTVISKAGIFASASKGIIIKLFGKTSHAAHPEDGLSPAIPMTEIIRQLTNLPQRKDLCKDYFLVTVIHARLGEIAFGTSPGYAEVMATLRSYRDEDMLALTNEIEKIIKESSSSANLKYEISFTDVFPSTVNESSLVNILKDVSSKSGLKFEEVEEPFGWSDDFGYFSQLSQGLYFGLGAGKDHPQLHNADYDFPDILIPEGIFILSKIIEELL